MRDHKALPRLSLDGLAATLASFPADVRQEPNKATFYLVSAVIRYFLGKEWWTTNVVQDAANPDGFFRLDFSSDEKREAKTTRLMDFAETLFNLQHIAGFDDRVDQMRTGNLEATAAEFDFGRFLYLHDIDFAFIVPVGERGKDYDCEISFPDGRVACADAKCRMEDSDVRPEAIRHALETARKRNLPKHMAGIIFMKVPQTWIEQPNVSGAAAAVVRDFLRQTERIVSVVLYGVVLVHRDAERMIWMRHIFEEIENPNHRFDQSKSWLLFRDFSVPADWQGMPPKWHRIFSKGSLMSAQGTSSTLLGFSDDHRSLEAALSAVRDGSADAS